MATAVPTAAVAVGRLRRTGAEGDEQGRGESDGAEQTGVPTAVLEERSGREERCAA